MPRTTVRTLPLSSSNSGLANSALRVRYYNSVGTEVQAPVSGGWWGAGSFRNWAGTIPDVAEGGFISYEKSDGTVLAQEPVGDNVAGPLVTIQAATDLISLIKPVTDKLGTMIEVLQTYNRWNAQALELAPAGGGGGGGGSTQIVEKPIRVIDLQSPRIRQNDTLPVRCVMLVQANGLPFNLADASSITYKLVGRTVVKTVSGSAEPLDGSALAAALGIVSYPWVDGDTDTIGLYHETWTANYAGGGKLTFPTDQPIDFEVFA